MVELKEDFFMKQKRDTLAQLHKIQSIIPEYLFEDDGIVMQNYISIYKTKNIFLIFGTIKEYIGRIFYDSQSPNKLNIRGDLEIIKPIAHELEEHGFEVTIYY